MDIVEQKKAAEKFANDWKGRGAEKQDTQHFWNQLLRTVYGVETPEQYIKYEKEVAKGYIDGYIAETRVLIEQKGAAFSLDVKELRQGRMVTPYEQARDYVSQLSYDEKPRYIVTSNFQTIRIYDCKIQPSYDRKTDTWHAPYEEIALKDLPKECGRLNFLVNVEDQNIKKEMEVSIQAGELVGVLYDALIEEYKDPTSEKSLRSLNVLCVRLVFCLYAEDAGVFGKRNMFHDYMVQYDAMSFREELRRLFQVLDQRPEERDPYLRPDLAAFPYVNGGLFADENIEIPNFTDEIRDVLLSKASADFDWSGISPTIFGAVFESTLNPVTRRFGGMHYTSIENIHKVIDPLFLNDLKFELDSILRLKTVTRRMERLNAFQEKLATIICLDPAAGSGNFLTESYLSLRRLENQVLKAIYDVPQFGATIPNAIKVSIGQFYGIEINDFAVTVARTALWIAENQTLQETKSILHVEDEFLPLKSYPNIHEGNALRIAWEDVAPKEKLRYIMGNPPFVGSSLLTEEQKEDREAIFTGKGGELDYVACWYKKATDYIDNTSIKCAFVSTNSISQGQQVAPLWETLAQQGIKITFAHRTFIWDSEASIKAHVYCIIVGFSKVASNKRLLFDGNTVQEVNNINGYLLPGNEVYVSKRSKPVCNVPQVIYGFKPADNGCLILDDEEKDELIKKEPQSEKWIRPFITAKEFIHGKNRWCLWLDGVSPAEIAKTTLVRNRIEKCREWRAAQTVTGDAYKLKDVPFLMRPCKKFMGGSFIVLPRHSGEKRRYIPFGYAKDGAIPGDSVSIITGAELYHFAILSSNVHMAWTKTVCGRLENRYRYSSDLVYNTFPWPKLSEEQKSALNRTAQGILDARVKYSDSSLADLYDPSLTPPELQKAHQENDRAVLDAYGFKKGTPAYTSEAGCVAELMKLYQAKIHEAAK